MLESRNRPHVVRWDDFDGQVEVDVAASEPAGYTRDDQ
jgi:hypothetical protein